MNWFSVDPEFKILKTISMKAPKEMLLKQLQEGDNVIKRVEAARALRDKSSDAVIDALANAVLHDEFWGVSAEAAKSLGAIKTSYAYEALKDCLVVKHPKVRRAVVKAIGEFKNEESLELIRPLLQDDESYFVKSEARDGDRQDQEQDGHCHLEKGYRNYHISKCRSARGNSRP